MTTGNDKVVICLIGITVFITCAGPSVAGGRLRFIRLDRPRSSLTFRGTWADRQYSGESFESETFRTFFTTGTSGSLLHPTLFTFNLRGTVTHVDYQYEGSSRGNIDENYFGYDFDANVVKEKTFPLNLFASKHIGEREQPFTASTKVENSSRGFDWWYRGDSLSVSFSGSEHHQVQENYQNSGLVLDSKDTLWSTSAHWKVNQNDFLFRYSHLTAENSLTDSSTVTESIFGQHSVAWGNKDWCMLTSRFGSSKYSGLNSLTTYNWTERLKLRHTDFFDTYYAYDTTTRKTTFSTGGTIESGTEGFESGLRHRVFRSLFTNAGLSVRRHTYENTVRDYYKANVSVNYQKSMPHGKLGVNLGQAYQIVRAKSSSSTTIAIFDESHTFTDPFPIIISRRNVQPSSVVVTDSSGATIYVEGVDYSLSLLPDQLEINRITTGAITDGQTVLVDYVYDTAYNARTASHSTSHGIRYSFNNGASVYYNYSNNRYDAEPDTAEDTSFENHIVGLGYNRRFVSGRYEYRDYHSAYPFTSHMVNLACNVKYLGELSSSLSSAWTLAKHEQPSSRTVDLFTLQVNNIWRISKSLSFNGSIQYRNEHDSVYGDEEGTGLSLGLDWKSRYTSVSIMGRRRRYESTTRSESSSVYVEVRRRF